MEQDSALVIRIIDYLTRAYQADARHMQHTDIPKGAWGWRNHRAIKIAMKRENGESGEQFQEWLDELERKGRLRARVSRRDKDSGSDYRLDS